MNVSNLNLNWTGSIDLGANLAMRDSGTGIGTVTIANTATGMSGGTIYAGHTFTSALQAATTSVSFASGGTGFNLSGGTIDDRSTTAAQGVLTQNGNALTISGGNLLVNSMAADAAGVRLSAGKLAMNNINAAAVSYTIATAAGSNNRTIEVHANDTGIFSVNNGAANSTITIPAQVDGGTWNLGTINADTNYTITGGLGSSFVSYAVAANTGLNGLAMGANAIPTTLTLGSGSSFFVSASTAAARTYNVGTGGGDDIQSPASGSFTFGINDQTAGNTQIINLNRDKGAGSITLVSNGTSASSAVNITTNQTGAGNLFINSKNVTINPGVTIGGTGGISQFDATGAFGTTTPSGLNNDAGLVNGATAANAVMTINGTINGTNSISMAVSSTNSLVLGSTAVVGGTQTWSVNTNSITSGTGFANQITAPTNWTNGAVTMSLTGGMRIEAATSTASPSTSSDYKFARINLASGNGGQNHTVGRLQNAVQNDGGSAKEALYVGTLDANGMADGSNGHFFMDLNGQDLYVDRFNNVTNANRKALIIGNSAAGSTSTLRALATTGDTLAGGGFWVVNGSALEIVGGSWNDAVYNRNTGGYPADIAAAPDSINSISTDTIRNWDNGAATAASAFVHFLGSGSNTGGNAGTGAAGTNGTVRIVGGSYTTSGYILNPVGTTGLIDTTSADGSTDTTLNDVTIRGNTAADSNGVGNNTAYPALIAAGTTTIKGNLVIANATGATNQATLRVGGDTPAATVTAHSGIGTLIVTGDLTTQSNVNVAIQSNGIVKVGGNTSIAAVGTNQSNNVTGLNGAGINAASNFTVNGNTGAATPQMINITPTIGLLHVGDGSAGALAGGGAAAQAKLAANLSAAGDMDINGTTSSLDLNGKTLALGSGKFLTSGGKLVGAGTVSGGSVSFVGGGELAPGSLTDVGTLNLSATTLAGTTTMKVAASGVSDFVDITGDFTSGGIINIAAITGFTGGLNNSYDLFDWSGSKYGSFSVGSLPSLTPDLEWNTTALDITGIITIQSVPEPALTGLLGIGALGLLARRRRHGAAGAITGGI